MSNKYYPAPKRRKVKSSSASPRRAATLPAPMSGIGSEPFQTYDRVCFVLKGGDTLVALVEGLEEDASAIYGVLSDGRNFALPVGNLNYCVEV